MTASGSTQAHRGVAAILEREWASVTRLLAALDPQAWGHPTRCSGWTILDLARHTVWGVSMEADALRRARTGQDGRADGLPATDLDPAAATDALRLAATDLVAEAATLDLGPGDSRTCPLPYADLALPTALDVFVFEAGIHAGDFAHAVGRDHPLAADVVPATSTVMSQFLPVFAAAGGSTPADGTSFALRGGTVRLDGRWVDSQLVMGDQGHEPTMTVAGDDSSVLLYAAGRLGVDDPRLSMDGSVELARDFKVYVPGP